MKLVKIGGLPNAERVEAVRVCIVKVFVRRGGAIGGQAVGGGEVERVNDRTRVLHLQD